MRGKAKILESQKVPNNIAKTRERLKRLLEPQARELFQIEAKNEAEAGVRTLRSELS